MTMRASILPPATYKLDVKQDATYHYVWRILSPRAKVIAICGHPYESRDAAIKAARKLARIAEAAVVE